MKQFAFPAALAAAAAFAMPAQAETPAEFYKGKTVQFIVGYNPGGGYDAYTRAAARFIDRHIPGSPTVIVMNMPGASSLKSVRYLAAQAPKDGTQFGMFNRGLITTSVMNPKTGVDFGKLTWIGSMNSEIAVCYLWKERGIASLAQLHSAKVNIGDTSKNSGGYVYSAILRSMTDGAAKPILGYATTGDIWLAIEKGELDGNCTVWSSLKTQRGQWLADGKVNVLVQFAKDPHPDLKQVPSVFELARTEPEKLALNFLIAAEAIGRPIVAPPGLPAERTQALRTAFERTMADPAFRAFAKKANMELDVVTGGRAEEIVKEIVATPKEAVNLAKDILK